MNAYNLMIQTNHYLIKNGSLTDSQKDNIVWQFFSAQTKPEQAKRFYQSVKFPNNIDSHGRQMYPVFFIPPYNDGVKLKTIFNQTPKTHIFSANMYELEIIRLLYLFAPNNPIVKEIVDKTLIRLRTTCFGNSDDGLGECFDTSLVVLRFLALVVPNDIGWIKGRIDNYNCHAGDRKRPWFAKWYFWLCLSELPLEIAESEINKYKGEFMPWLTTKSAIMNSEHDKMIHPVLICMLRNLMSRYPEYAHIKERQPYISEEDGRLHFDITQT
ncbi:hypothetical protein PAECIP111892_00760 [Paenibacillus auburnensis]|uniref:Uncharacterized protein n=1 Tax=Paenibacillus auburnensis TaxID=2905649 RepID=A0ABN8FY28_9BACL|nr:hypothetical protein [Paenibacillus auburnensis]CAH1191832.1 hypothetical protein PAECIP111892_00760 [Paenibacillus auburnensis]